MATVGEHPTFAEIAAGTKSVPDDLETTEFVAPVHEYNDIKYYTRQGSHDSNTTLQDEGRSHHEPHMSITTLASTAVDSPSDASSKVASLHGEDDDEQVFESIKAPNGATLTCLRMGPEYQEHQMRSARETRARIRRKQYPSTHRALSVVAWAPWHARMDQRLQTAAVLFHTVCIAVMLSTFWFFCAVPLFWPIVFPYLIFLAFSTAASDGKLRRRSEFFRTLPIWDYFAAYFPARLYRSEVLSPNRKYLFGYHPHGILSEGAFIAFGTDALGFSKLFPGITNSLLTLESNFRLPFFSEYLLALGLRSVSRESCTNHLTVGGSDGHGRGRGITIVVGGASESLHSQPGTMKLVLKSRFGFVKIALEAGADLVPVVCFGENELYDQFLPESDGSMVRRFQMWAKKVLGFTVPLAHARGVFNYNAGLLAYRRRLDIVVGKPIKVRQMHEKDEGFKQELERLHSEYMQSLHQLWDTWNSEFRLGDEEKEVSMQFVG